MKLAPESFPIPGGKKPKPKQQKQTNAKKTKTTNKSDISIYWTRKKKQWWESQ